MQRFLRGSVLEEADFLGEHKDEDISLHEGIIVVVAVEKVHGIQRRSSSAYRVVMEDVDCALRVLIVSDLEI